MTEDIDLLRDYAHNGSEAAFAELVRRRIGLVYSVAFRHTHDAHLAEDATQTVFADLARKAVALSRHAVLVGWLHRSAHYAAMNLMRTEWSRAGREQEAQLMHEIFASDQSPAEWEKARPLLDEVLSELDARDRDAILLRFFDGCGFAEVGARLGLNENAARMRVERALDKLQAAFARRRLASTTGVLSTVLAHQALATVPEGLAATITSGALASAAATATPALTFLQAMGTTKMIVGVGGAVLAAAMVGAGYQTHVRRAAEEKFAAVQQEQTALKQQLLQVEQATVGMESRLGELKQVVTEAQKKRAAQAAAAQSAPARHANWDPEAEGAALLARYPELKRWVQMVADAGIEERLGRFFRSIGLNAAQIAELKLLMRESSSMGVSFNGERVSLRAGTGMRWEEVNRRQSALLGEENLAKMKAYYEAAPDRDLTMRLAGALCFSETPLTPAQSERLIQLIGENRQRSAGGVPGPVDWDKVLTAAKEQLSSAQLKALEALRPEVAQEALYFATAP